MSLGERRNWLLYLVGNSRGVAKVRMHTAIGYACILAVAITAHRIGRPDLANSIATFTY